MKVSEYAKLMGISRAGAYYRVSHGLVPAYTKMGHWLVDETQIDWETRDRQIDTATLDALMKIFGMTRGEDDEGG